MTEGYVTKEALEERLRKLIVERDQLTANIHAYEGAISVVKELLALPSDDSDNKKEK